MAISNVTPPANNPDFATAAAAAGFRVWDQNGQWVTDGVQATVQAFLDADAPLARNKAKAIAALQAEFTRRLNLLTDSAQYTVSMTIIARILDLTQRGTAVPAGLAALRNAASSMTCSRWPANTGLPWPRSTASAMPGRRIRSMSRPPPSGLEPLLGAAFGCHV
jgi:hypothetical protein